MTAKLSVNFVTGFTAAAPNQSQFYLMAEVDDPRVFNSEMNATQEGSMQGFAHQADRRAAPPQVPVGSAIGAFATSVDGNVEWIMAEVDDPRSSGGKFVHPDKLNKGPSNYPPQIGS
jgi:hypothetical protein